MIIVKTFKRVPRVGLEPTRTHCSRDFKSLVSTIPPPWHRVLRAENETRTRDLNLGKVALYH